MNKILIVYYSFSKTTESLAEDIAIITDGDIRKLIPEKPYSFSYNGATKELRREIEKEFCPKLVFGSEPIDDYKYVFIGSPNWFKSLAPPVLSFLRNFDFSNKIIIPFCTHGGGGFGKIQFDISKECPNSKLLQGFETTSGYDDKLVYDWINKINIFEDSNLKG